MCCTSAAPVEALREPQSLHDGGHGARARHTAKKLTRADVRDEMACITQKHRVVIVGTHNVDQRTAEAAGGGELSELARIERARLGGDVTATEVEDSLNGVQRNLPDSDKESRAGESQGSRAHGW